MKIIFRLTKKINRLIYRRQFEKVYYLKAMPGIWQKAKTSSWKKIIPVKIINLPVFSLPRIKPSLAPVIFGLAIIAGIGILLIKNNPLSPKAKAFSLQLYPAPASSNYLYQNTTNGFKVYLGNRLEETKPRIKFEQNSSSAEFSFAQFPNPNSQFEKDSNSSVIYKNIYPGVDIKYYLTEKGIKEEIVIKDRTKNNNFVFNLNLKNAIPKKSLENKTSGFFIDPNSQEYVFHIPQPFMIDAVGNRSEAVDLKINQQLIISNDGTQILYTITLVPNQEWLQSAAYPVIIDPSVVHDESSEFSGTTNRIDDEGSGTTPKLRIPYHELPADEHTAGLWHLNETVAGNAQDSSGNGNHQTSGSTSNITTTNQKLGAAARTFNGSSDYIFVNDSSSLDISQELTVEVWFYRDTAGNYDWLVDKWWDASNRSWYTDIRNTGVLHFCVSHSGSACNVEVYGSTFVSLNKWHHAAFTFDGTVGRIYLDGSLDGTAVSAGVIKTNSSKLAIGAYYNNNSPTYYFHGNLDEVRVSNIARTAEEIKQDAQRFPYGVYTSDSIDLTSGEGTVASLDSLEWTDNVSTPGATLDGYPYFKPVIIDNTQNSNELTDYQVKVDVDYNFNMQSDFDDLRFTSSTYSLAYGSEYEYNQTNTGYNATSTLDSTHFVVAYKDDGGSDYGCARVCTVSGSTISSCGTEQCFNQADTANISVDTLDSTHFVVAYTDVGGDFSYKGRAVIGTVTGGTTISFGNEYMFNDGITYNVSAAVLDSTHFVAAFEDQSNNQHGTATIGTVSGSTISYGNEYEFNEAATNWVDVAALDSTHFVAVYDDGGNNDYGTARVGTVSGSIISYNGNEYVYNSAATIRNGVAELDSSTFVVSYDDNNNGTAVVGKVTDSTITFGHEYVYNAAFSWTNSGHVGVLDSLHFVVPYSDSGNSNKGTAIIGTVFGKSISFGQEYVFNDASTNDPYGVACLETTKCAIVFTDGGNSFYGTAIIGTTDDSLDYWIEKKSDGVEAEVWVEVDTILASELTTIWMWYGSPGSSAGSNGSNTFVFFDDFNDGSLNGTLWNSAGTVSESGGVVTITNSGSYIGSKTSYGVNYSLRYRGKHPDVESNWVGFISGASPPFAIFERYATGQWNARSYVSAETITGLSLVLLGTYNQYEIERNNGSFNMYSVNDGISSFGTHTTQVTSNNLPLTAYMSGTGSLSLDWIALRSFTSIEPIAGVGADVEFQTRTSSDGSTWESWKPTTNETAIASMDSDATNWSTSSTAMLTKTDESNIKMEGDGSLKSTIGAPQTDANTRGLWHFEETGGTGAYILDETDLSNDLSVSGTANVVDGFFGKARDFSSGDLSCTDANCGGTTKLDYPGSGGWSVGAWVKLDTLASGADQQIAIKWYWNSGTDNGGYVLQLSDATDNFRFGVANSSGSANYNLLTSTTVPSLDQWYHVVGVYNGLNTKIYVNGNLENSAAYSGGVKDISQDFLIGNLTAHYLNGAIDEPFVTTKALTSEEIAEAYRAGRDHRLQRTISSTDLSGKTKIPFYFAADKQGTIAETYIGETDHAVYGSDSNTKGLWHLDEETADWRYPGWTKRREITVTNNVASNLTNHQVEVSITHNTDMQADFDDLRFTNSSHRDLSYWIESKTDGASATVWVEVDYLPASSSRTIYMYYGNTEASAGSDGDNTFLFFDGFTGASLDTTKWPSTSQTPVVSGGNLVLDATGGGTETVRGNTTHISNITMEYRAYFSNTANYNRSGFSNSSAGTSMGNDDANYIIHSYYTGLWGARTVNEGSTTGFDSSPKDTSWHVYKIDWTSSTLTAWRDTAYVFFGNTANESCYVRLEEYDHASAAGTYYVDWVFVRKYASTEPSATVTSIEETGGLNTIRDSSGNENDGGANGTSFTQGKIGGARYFNGTNDYIEVPDDSSIGITGNLTVETWINPSVVIGDNTTSRWLEKGDGYLLLETNVDCSDGGGTNPGVTFLVKQSNVNKCVKSVETLSPGNWYHVAGVYDGSNLKIYVNGDLRNSNGLTGSIDDDNLALRIGADDSTYYFNGIVDEVRISNTARTPDEIRLAYQYGLRTHQVTADYVTTAGSDGPTSTSDLQFTPDTTTNLYEGDTVIVRENYNGTNYIMQGEVSSISSGLVTVASWSGTAPSGGYTTNADVFKWQREYWDLKDISPADRNATVRLGLRILDANEGFTMYLDDFRSNTNYLTNNLGSTIASTANRYIQYQAILSTNSTEVTPELTSVTLDYNRYPTAPTNLLAEGQINPSGVTDLSPEFSAIYNDPDSGDVANKYWIQVDDNSDFGSTIWDSGSLGTAMSNCTEGTRCEDIIYGGASTDLQWGTKYYWRIKFWDEGEAEGAWSTEEAYFVMDVFKAPTGCHMDDGSQPGQVTIYWQDNDNKETGFRIEKEIDGSGFAFLTTEAIDSTSYLDNTTSVDHTYQYRIRGNSNNGNTTWCGTTMADFSEGNFKFEGIRMEGLKIE